MEESALFLQIGIPLIGFVLFFVVQALGRTSEGALSFTALVLSGLIFMLRYNQGEIALFLTGILFGLIIEIGLRRLGSQQTWHRASFFGVPYWLPIAWGIGFVIITRLGIFIRGISL